jgi:hypothetical protein
MAVGIVSIESLSNRLHRMSRQNGDPVIGLLRHRDTLIAERLEGFGREFRALSILVATTHPARELAAMS